MVLTQSTPRPGTDSAAAHARLDEAYETLSASGHRLDGGPYCHAPMVAEALEALSMTPAIPGYIREQVRGGTLVPRPAPAAPIDLKSPPFGDENRQTDWAQFFERNLSQRGVQETIAEWVPILTPTAYAAAGHALIRVGHALRALSRTDTPARREELACALGSWASMHHAARIDLDNPAPRLGPAQALASVPLAETPASTATISGGIAAGFSLPGFQDAMRAADLSGQEAADDVLRVLTRMFLDHAVSPFTAMAYCHAVTACAAARTIGLSLTAPAAEALLRQAFAVGVAIKAGFHGLDGDIDPGPDDMLDPASLTLRAVESGTDHAIKFTEACLSAHSRLQDPIFLQAANRGLRFLESE